MAESSNQRTTSSRFSLKTVVGEIVEVQGGHIVRSTGRKDRHSKVCTAKGPRDRRVRLAAHTAIQFYDVQDRLGFDRPSKAVDWLIKKAKSAIDDLAQLPAWHPTSFPGPSSGFEPDNSQQKLEEEDQQHNHQRDGDLERHNFMNRGGIVSNSNAQMSSFLPPSMDSDVIADTIKSFFPMGASDEATTTSMQFQSFPTPDLMQRSSNHSQDLRLSLQSFRDPIMLHHHQQNQQNHSPSQHGEDTHLQSRVFLSGTPIGFDTAPAGWPEHYQFQRLAAWNPGGDTASAAASGGFYFNAPPAPQPLLQQLLGHNQFFTQRGPLQSSNSPSVRAWVDPPSSVEISGVDHGQQPILHHQIYPSSVGFASGYGGFTGFHIPARIQGDEEEHDGYSDKPSSASSDSRH